MISGFLEKGNCRSAGGASRREKANKRRAGTPAKNFSAFSGAGAAFPEGFLS